MHTLYTQCLSISLSRDWLLMFSDCSCDWQMGKKNGRVQKHATRAQSASEGSDAEESESGDLSGTNSEKQRLFDTRAELREAKQESLLFAGDIVEDDEADDDDADDDDDDTHTKESVRLLLLQPRPSLVMRFESTTLLSMTLTHPLQTSRSSGRSMRPNVKQILIAQTPPPMPPLLVPLTSTFRTRTDPHIFNVFRNAQIKLRILIICESYPFLFVSLFLFYICAYSRHSLYSGLILVLTCFLFSPYCCSRCRKLSSYSLSKRRLLYSFIFVHISYIYIYIYIYCFSAPRHRLLLF
jgi:hypothetical protein